MAAALLKMPQRSIESSACLIMDKEVEASAISLLVPNHFEADRNGSECVESERVMEEEDSNRRFKTGGTSLLAEILRLLHRQMVPSIAVTLGRLVVSKPLQRISRFRSGRAGGLRLL